MWYINKGTELQSGNGLPFVKYLAYLATNRNKTYQDINGLWRVPVGKLPSFQIVVPEDTFVTALLTETTGEGIFTGSTAIPIGGFNSTNITKNGANFTIWEYEPTYIHAGAVEGRFLIDLTLSLSLVEQHYYSEEFVMVNCC